MALETQNQSNGGGSEPGTLPSTTAKIANAGRLDAKAGKLLRIEMERLLKGPKFNNDFRKFTRALEMSPGGVRNNLDNKTNGSIDTARKVCKLASIPLESIVGPDVAQLAAIKLRKERAEADRVPESQRRMPVASPPPPPGPVYRREEGVNGLKLGDVLDRPEIAPQDLEDLRRGRALQPVQARIAEDYEELQALVFRMRNWILKRTIGF